MKTNLKLLIILFFLALQMSSFSQGYELWAWGLNDQGQLAQ